MFFDFDVEKTIAAVAYLIQKEGGEVNFFLALKMLYVADKDALIQWGKPITGDDFVSMDKGPVLSKTYNFFKGTGREDQQALWNSAITERLSHAVRLIREVDLAILSEREVEALESARLQIKSMPPWRVPRWLHDTCPEWQDPHGSSIPIDPATILRFAGKTEEEIRDIEKENDEVGFLNYLLNSR